ncbi:hypothetical protein AAW14_26555 [Streptomyces hygroscopicus]|nr:hypothetical protein [Streptomyces hygroscopicus]
MFDRDTNVFGGTALSRTGRCDVADHLIGHFVDQARRSGASWTDIGKSMGVTRQAAQKRFVPKESAGLDPSQGFSRYTVRARNVVMAAHNEAKARGQQRDRPSGSAATASAPSTSSSRSSNWRTERVC